MQVCIEYCYNVNLILTRVVQKLYPTRLADKSWDNTGLLLEATSTDIESDKLRVLLTIDLTQSVVSEAIQLRSNVIMAYHPFIFKGLKAITSDDPQQRSLLRLIRNNISVYCPHTAVDSALGGVNDFLADGLISGYEETSRVPLQPAEDEGCGMGRYVTLKQPVSLRELVENLKASLGLENVMVAPGHDKASSHQVSTIAICAGSGGSVFSGIKADLYYTGELSHHQALFLKENGSSIIVCNHSNTERAFLAVMRKHLAELLPDAEIHLSQEDKDPYEFW